MAASLDGFVAPPDGSAGWLEGVSGGTSFTDFVEGVGGIVMGRNGFETELGFGPWSYGHLPVLVMTNRRIDSQPQGVETAAGDPAPALLALRAKIAHGDVWLFGGGTVAGSFLEAGLIDRIEITTVPVLLRRGRSLFGEAGALRRLKLVDCWAEGSIAQSIYVPA